MAEEDVMLVAIRMDAKGAIEDADVLDTKFDKLGNTLRKGKARTEGMEQAQKKLNESIKQSTDTTVKSNVAFIGKLAAFEAITSATNQLISAQYKRIDADLAAGKISQEEAEELRKNVKQYEKYTGLLETGIALARFGTVIQMAYNAALAMTAKNTDKATLSTTAFNFALKQNPIILIISSIVLLLGYMIAMEKIFGKTTKTIDAVTESFRKLHEMWSRVLELANPFDNIIESVEMVGRNRMNSQMGA
tara:strand:+ start:532 stop:1275 length:744 start_codon:yes stop_codon:yes gene_type:complete